MALTTIEREDGMAVVTLNRPEAMNALSNDLLAEIATAFLQLRDDPSVRAIVLTGAGTRAFSAGADLKELGDRSELHGPGDNPEDPIRLIETCGKPVIGAINGVAITGGLELALACDILIGSENARFADTHARVGILPGWGLSQKLSRLIGISRAKEMSLTGNFIDAKTAADWGLINRVVAAEELIPAACQLAQDIASIDPGTIQTYKTLIDDGFARDYAAARDLEQEYSDANLAQIKTSDIEARRGGILDRGRGQID